MSKSKRNITNVIKDNFRFSTLSFIFIIFYVNIFQILFGPENSIVGVIFTIMMSASMVRDLTATPFRHLFIQALVLVWMAAAAFWVSTLPAPLSFVINFIRLLVILYAFSYEYSNNIFIPYIYFSGKCTAASEKNAGYGSRRCVYYAVSVDHGKKKSGGDCKRCAD